MVSLHIFQSSRTSIFLWRVGASALAYLALVQSRGLSLPFTKHALLSPVPIESDSVIDEILDESPSSSLRREYVAM